MSRRSERALWMTAFTGSIIVHAALAFAFALTPAAERPQPPETEIVFQPLPSAVAGEPQSSQVLAMHASSGEEAVPASAAGIAAAPLLGVVAAASVPVERMAGPADESAAAEAVDRAVFSVAVEAEEIATDASEAPEVVAADTRGGGIATRARTGDATAPITFDTAAVPSAAPQAVAAAAPSHERSARVAVPAGSVALSPDAMAMGGQAAPRADAHADTALAVAEARVATLTPVAAAQAAAPSAAPVAAAVPAASAAPVAASRPPDAAVPAPPMPRQSPAQAYQALLGVIVGESGAEKGRGGCFMALASADGDAIGVDGFAAEEGRLDRLGRDLGDAVDLPVDLRRHAVSTPQCAALAFTGGLASYPEPVLSVELEATTVASGGEIAGTVRNIARPWFYLLVIDDAGRVQEIERGRLAATAPGTVAFRFPLTLVDDAAETVQLLLAVASDEILEMVWLREGQQARIYFDDLRDEIVASGGGVDFGITPFVLR